MRTFLLFDIDGTLLHSDRTDSRCFASSYEATFGKPFPTIDWTKYPHVTDHVIFRTAHTDQFGREASEEERLTFEEHYLAQLRRKRAATPQTFREVPGAAALWDHLQQDERYVTGIATGGWRRPAQIKLAHVGIPPEQPYGAYADGMETREAILGAAIELARGQHAVDRVVYVGDAAWDVRTCRNMGLPFIGVRHRGDHEQLRRHGAAEVVTDYRDVEGFMALVEQVAIGA